MQVLRSVGSVILGYLVFAVSAFAFFQISGHAPHAPAPLPIMLGSILVGILFAFIGGYLAATLAGRKPAAHGLAVAVILALFFAHMFVTSQYGKNCIYQQLLAQLAS